MNKEQFKEAYFSFCLFHNLAPENVIVSAGGVLLMLGLRAETEDLDLDIPAELYDILLSKPEYYKLMHKPNGTYLEIGQCSMHRGLTEGTTTMVIEGVYCYDVASVLHQKKNLKRYPDAVLKLEQDKKDIAALEALLAA